ncbi:hypothetical protein DASC09_019680 [Saccharomycopsis crataegensis]|uniref:FAR1 domain-containing protein n=1 Tax=Saccharomycopsis crataegensis TaxID=43959 RepID=A0AAV5QIP9_9ASCO|nr:hypothetical protein DASC09_019680 [Saccharomycopsis crataegensis]
MNVSKRTYDDTKDSVATHFINTSTHDIEDGVIVPAKRFRESGGQLEDTHSSLYHILNLDEINSKDRRDTSLTFRYAIKPWLQGKLAPLGIFLTIERSDTKKIVFRCRNKIPIDDIDAANDPHLADDRDIVTNTAGRKFRGCPFKIRANYSKKSDKWNISVVCDRHNHELVPHKSFQSSTLSLNNVGNNGRMQPQRPMMSPVTAGGVPAVSVMPSVTASGAMNNNNNNVMPQSQMQVGNSVQNLQAHEFARVPYSIASAAAAAVAASERDLYQGLYMPQASGYGADLTSSAAASAAALTRLVQMAEGNNNTLLKDKTDEFIKLAHNVVLEKIINSADRTMEQKTRIVEEMLNGLHKVLQKERVL